MSSQLPNTNMYFLYISVEPYLLNVAPICIIWSPSLSACGKLPSIEVHSISKEQITKGAIPKFLSV